MSTKSHTRNELARISAKIQQLKRKYPTSSELYLHNQKHNSLQKDQSLFPMSISIDHQSSFDTNNIEHKSNMNCSKNSVNNYTKENNLNGPNVLKFINKELNVNHKHEEGKLNQRCYKIPSFNRKVNQPIVQDFVCQKPFHQYKEELKHLKKQILSSLDISNFEVSKSKLLKNPNISPQSYDTFDRCVKQHLQNTIHQQDQNEIDQTKDVLIKTLQINKNNDKSNQSLETYQNCLSKNQYLRMDALIQNLSDDFCSYKHQMSERLSKLQFQSHASIEEILEAKNSIQIIQQKLMTPKSQKFSQYDFKLVEIQNKSISKLTKQVYKEIQSINVQLNNIKNVSFSSQKSQQKGQILEMVLKSIQKYEKEATEANKKRLQENQCKFFREIFDLKNQIQLMNEKLRKQDYLEKAIKKLLPSNIRTNQQKIDEVFEKVKCHLQKDSDFFFNLKNSIEPLFDQKMQCVFGNAVSELSNQVKENIKLIHVEIDTKVLEGGKKMKQQTSRFILSSLKQLETKMVTYGILIQHMEEGLKQLSDSVNEVPKQDQLFDEFKNTIQTQITSKVQQKFNSLKEIFSVKSIGNPQIHNKDLQFPTQIETYSIKPLSQENYKNSIQNSNVSIFTTQQIDNAFWLTNIDEKSGKKLTNSQISCGQKKKEQRNQSFLLEDLVRNSLVFGALNH